MDNTKGNWPIEDLWAIVVAFSDREHIWITIYLVAQTKHLNQNTDLNINGCNDLIVVAEDKSFHVQLNKKLVNKQMLQH